MILFTIMVQGVCGLPGAGYWVLVLRVGNCLHICVRRGLELNGICLLVGTTHPTMVVVWA